MPKKPPTITTYVKPERMPVFATLMAAVQDTLAAFRAMPALFVAGFVIFFAKRLLRGPLNVPPIEETDRLAIEASAFVETAVMGLLTVPLIVALHRFAILKETNSPSSLLWKRDTVILYFIVSLAPSVAFLMLSLAMSVAPERTAWPFLLIIIELIALFWMIRFILVLPAIAVEAPNASLNGSARATQGGFWRLLMVLTLSLATPMCLGYGLVYVADGAGLGLFGSAAFAICATIALAVGTMALSHAFIWRSQGPYGRRAALRRATMMETS